MRFRSVRVIWLGVTILFVAGLASAATLCVSPTGAHGCYTTISAAVANAEPYDVILVAPGVYKEEVTIGIPLSLLGAGANFPATSPGACSGPDGGSIIDATGLAHGIFVDGLDHPSLAGVTIAGFTVRDAQYEGILLLSAADVTVRNNQVLNNDRDPGLSFTGALTACPGQPGSDVYENDETGDCGGAVHLIGTDASVIAGNLITGNADGVLISDETRESRGNLLIGNDIENNPLECGIVLASHPPIGNLSGPHYGVDDNTVADNLSENNGVQVSGAGVEIASDGSGPGRASGNVIIDNQLIHNGDGGVSIHSHVGPAFGAPADDMSGNKIIGNFIARNLAAGADTATTGPVGVNINSGGGGSPIYGTVVSGNVIEQESVDIAVNTPAEVNIHLNQLLGNQMGVADVCAEDGGVCTGHIDATENYWGCPAGPGGRGCSTVSGTDIHSTPWLLLPPSVRHGWHTPGQGR